MKKASLFVLVLVLSLGFMVSSASAATELNTKIDKVLDVRYLTAGTTTKGFDCSGFTRYIYAQLDIDLSHSSKVQSTTGDKIAQDDLRAGDLVFFNTGRSGSPNTAANISHVGIYIGDGYFAHSASDSGVTKSKLSEKYYANRYVSARRIMSDTAYAKFAEEKQAAPVVKKDDDSKTKIDNTDPQTESNTKPVTGSDESQSE